MLNDFNDLAGSSWHEDGRAQDVVPRRGSHSQLSNGKNAIGSLSAGLVQELCIDFIGLIALIAVALRPQTLVFATTSVRGGGGPDMNSLSSLSAGEDRTTGQHCPRQPDIRTPS